MNLLQLLIFIIILACFGFSLPAIATIVGTRIAIETAYYFFKGLPQAMTDAKASR